MRSILAMRKALKSHGVSQVAGLVVIERFLDDVAAALEKSGKAGATEVLEAVQSVAASPRWAPMPTPRADLVRTIEREKQYLKNRHRLLYANDDALLFAGTGVKGGKMRKAGVSLDYRNDAPPGARPRYLRPGKGVQNEDDE
jgi:hypothetical protein